MLQGVEPTAFRQLIAWAAIASVAAGALIGVTWSLIRPETSSTVRRLRLSRWALRIDLQAGIFGLAAGLGLAVAGAYYYGRPWPWSTQTFDPGSHDLLDALIAVVGVLSAGGGAFLLAENTVNRIRQRIRPP
jgi:hypothetical protein